MTVAPTGGKPSLRETMETMHRLMRGELTPEQAASRLGSPVGRTAVYQRFAQNHVRAFLEKNFEILAALVGGETWEPLVAGYFAAHPSRHYELNANAAAFPDYVAARAARVELGLTPFHAELAEVEWREFEVFVDPEEIARPEQLTAAVLNRTLVILQLKYPVAEFIAEWREAEKASDASLRPATPTEESPEIVFVMRHPESDGALVRRADDGLLFAFKMLHDRMDVRQAMEVSGLSEAEVRAILERAARLGLVIFPDSHDGRVIPFPSQTR
ncbi:MAG: hypothetical protein C4523_17570 [Myxococcales bacterium]|nr:MAG: hypothetical protein C4523_17570 [Myxococcales bacterium]